tara:strand:- start:1652 stop:2020 length:369 start_codon:yes stop_codon:yes gene_type:complete
MIETYIEQTDDKVIHKIEYALSLFKGCQSRVLGNIPNNMNEWHKYTPKKAIPYHLHPEVCRISQHYHKTNIITAQDEQFLDTVYTNTHEWLSARAYVLGQWVKFPTEKPKTHNLVTGNTFKR